MNDILFVTFGLCCFAGGYLLLWCCALLMPPPTSMHSVLHSERGAAGGSA
jgi:hypothetical protein